MSTDPESYPYGIGAEAPRPVHTYTMLAPNQISVFKRTDMREITQVGVMLIIDGQISGREIAEKICSIFEMELVSRGVARGEK